MAKKDKTTLTAADWERSALEMIAEHTGEMVLLDLIPAIFFMDHYSTSFLLEFTKQVIDMFGGRLVLGISDEISQVGSIEKDSRNTFTVYITLYI